MDKSMDELLLDLDSLSGTYGHEIDDLAKNVQTGNYKAVLESSFARKILASGSGGERWPQKVRDGLRFALEDSASESEFGQKRRRYLSATLIGLSAFHAFLQANVTGPPLAFEVGSVLLGNKMGVEERRQVRKDCLEDLEVDGVSVYQLIPEVELFCLARIILLGASGPVVPGYSSRWMRLRINAFHLRLLTATCKTSDGGLELQMSLELDLRALYEEVFGESSRFHRDVRVQFLLERAQIYIMQGMDLKARNDLDQATKVSGLRYLLSGALGKRTKFQQTDVSQLVVFAKSHENDVKSASPKATSASNGALPASIELNDDTLLESIAFAKYKHAPELPSELQGMSPENQPQLNPLDQIILLTEATIKDSFSPLDELNREEILPFATRVLADKPTNYQIYTQALLVRSRIESHRSRTQERSVLQLQTIVDQIIADTEGIESGNASEQSASNGLPQIKVTSFLPKAKYEESAPATERLKYIHQLHTPTRWEIESELAFAWSNVGGLVSALEIFKRLELWAEVALCYYSVHQEDKARQVIRRQLFHSRRGPGMDDFPFDAPEVLAEEWDGELRSPAPPHAPRLWCILGDLDRDPSCWERAWQISNQRFARAQRTLGEYYTTKGDLSRAREAYVKAAVVSRQNGETWSRLGDIDLKLGNWDGAIIAFQQAIRIDDTDAKTYSNLGSALLSKHAEMLRLAKLEGTVAGGAEDGLDANEDEDLGVTTTTTTTTKEQKPRPDPKDVLRQALMAYKKGATLAHDNWQIWDNVITIAGRMSPPSYREILLGLSAVIRIRGPALGEDAIDADVLRALIRAVTTQERPVHRTRDRVADVSAPPRGTLARAVVDLVARDIVPLITTRSELWSVIEQLAIYRRDYRDALTCAEKAWRGATAGEGWLEKKEMWAGVAQATDSLAAALESYGPMEMAGGGAVERGWRMKARSAVRGVLGRARGVWDETTEFKMLEGRLEELKGGG